MDDFCQHRLQCHSLGLCKQSCFRDARVHQLTYFTERYWTHDFFPCRRQPVRIHPCLASLSLIMRSCRASANLKMELSQVSSLGESWNQTNLIQFGSALDEPSPTTANAGDLVGNRMFWNSDYMVSYTRILHLSPININHTGPPHKQHGHNPQDALHPHRNL